MDKGETKLHRGMLLLSQGASASSFFTPLPMVEVGKGERARHTFKSTASLGSAPWGRQVTIG